MLKLILFLCLMILSVVNSDTMCDPFFNPYAVFNETVVDYWCFDYYINLIGDQDCKWDTWATDKKEGGRNQQSQLQVEEHYNIYSSPKWNLKKVVVLYQKYSASPIINGEKILVNNEHEHLAKYSPQTVNSVRSVSTTVETSKEIGVGFLGKLIGSLGKDAGVSGEIGGNFAFSKTQDNSKTETTSFTDWGVENKKHGESSKWTIHQQYPFDGDEDTPQKYMNWIGKATDRNYKHQFKYYAKTLPKLSINTIEGCVISVWLMDNKTDNFEITTKASHGLGDWVVGSNIKYHNNYHEKEHTYQSTKNIYLTNKSFTYYDTQYDKDISPKH
ncbi:hypothetical protein ACTFIY_008982 [Dictyostelium cf. discoideum]